LIVLLAGMATSLGAAAQWPAAGQLPAAGSALIAARNVRTQGCGAHPGISVVLRDSGALDAAALRWSRGGSLQSAVEQSGYREEQSAALHISGDAAALQQALASRYCAQLTDGRYIDLGSAQRSRDTWIIIAVPFASPVQADANEITSELLQQINRARARSRRCGDKTFPPAAPLQPNAQLRAAAEAHAQDMLNGNFFAHEGYNGSTPAQRVAATGYHYQIVGENIAFGPQSAAEAAAGWLASPEHCENIMDPRFSDSGIAYAANRSGTPRIYWVQVFASHPPRADPERASPAAIR
jgi:uncharacterized protein YkwD